MVQPLTRKLAVILHADVVGSSALVQLDETLAHQRIRDAFVRFGRMIERYGGKTREVRGDALVAEFARVSDALCASLAFQQENERHNASLEDTMVPVLRAGVAMGEVIIADNTVTGAGVVMAQRLEQLADHGGVCIQGAAYETVPARMPFDYEFLGEQRVKGFDEPVRPYRVNLRPGAAVPEPDPSDRTDSEAAAGREKPTIAVLPFENMSGDPEQEYFSDGISDDIINALSYFKSFPVIARNSTFTYKGQTVPVQQVSRELGARYVLEGSVRKSGNRVRIATRLSDAQSGLHVWAEKFDRTLADIFEVQDEITQKIVATIQPELAEAELEKVAVKRPENLTAWDLVLRGMSLVNRHRKADYGPGRDLFHAALEIDPAYSEAWSGIAWSYLANVVLLGPEERKTMLRDGMTAAKKAVELDDRSAIAHYVLGVAYAWDEQYQKSISEAELSLQLNPYSAQTHMGLGNRLDLIGRTLEGIEKMEYGLQLSPRDPFCPTVMSFLSRAFLSLEQPEKAIEWIRKGVGLKPDNPDLHYRHAVCLACMDQVDEAKQALAESERLQPGFVESKQTWVPYADELRNERFFAGFRRHGLN